MSGEHYISPVPVEDMTGVRCPNLFVAFRVGPAAYRSSNAYVISEQGKLPDSVLEIASRPTGGEDTGPKREAYVTLGIGEYWRFDETGRYHGTRLAGERLVDGEYAAIDIEELPDGSLQGYSAALDLHLRWEAGELVFRTRPRPGRSPHWNMNGLGPMPSVRLGPPKPASGSWKTNSTARACDGTHRGQSQRY